MLQTEQQLPFIIFIFFLKRSTFSHTYFLGPHFASLWCIKHYINTEFAAVFLKPMLSNLKSIQHWYEKEPVCYIISQYQKVFITTRVKKCTGVTVHLGRCFRGKQSLSGYFLYNFTPLLRTPFCT